jgi:hypothetical protein
MVTGTGMATGLICGGEALNGHVSGLGGGASCIEGAGEARWGSRCSCGSETSWRSTYRVAVSGVSGCEKAGGGWERRRKSVVDDGPARLFRLPA